MLLIVCGMALATARIPELSPLTTGLPLDMGDQLPIFISSENKTKKVSLSDLNTFFNLGGGGTTHAPVSYGGEMIVVISAAQVNSFTISIPSLAGKDFSLERGGLPLIPLLADNSNASSAEFEVLDAGGFKLLNDSPPVSEGERFKLSIFSLIGGNAVVTPSSSSFIRGVKQVSTNITLDPVNDINKLIQVRGGSNALTINLPSVEDIADNSFFCFELDITNTKPSQIGTSGGQFIYINNSSKTGIYMHAGEVLWLYRSSDGWYVINDFWRQYRGIGVPAAAYQVEIGELVCKGQEVNRADYPRLWEKAQTLGNSFVSDTDWQLANVYRQGNTYTTTVPVSGTYETIPRPYRGCFSNGNGTTTFRLPDLMNMALRAVKAESGADNERYQGTNRGMYQKHMYESHSHTMTFTELPDGESGAPGYDGGNNHYDTNETKTTSSSGGSETRMDNIGVLWVIKY